MTAPATPPDWDAIARYLAGESDTGESAVVRSWLEANPGDRDLVQQLDSAANVEALNDIDVGAALARVHQKMGAPDRPSLRLERGGAAGVTTAKSSRKGLITTIAGLAAAAAVVFAIMQNRSRAPLPVASREYSTGVATRDSVRLADGTRVILGPQSTLTVPGTFGTTERIVTLTGDAYFEVKHDASKPFHVRAGAALIEDVGTTFTIESDANAVATVSVVEGSVRLSRDRSGPAAGVVLAAGDRGTLEYSGQTSVEHNAVRPEDTQWINGRLSFRDTPLSRIGAALERWYGVKLRIADSTLLDRKVTTSFEGESVDNALKILELALGATITHQGDSVIISSPSGAHPKR